MQHEADIKIAAPILRGKSSPGTSLAVSCSCITTSIPPADAHEPGVDRFEVIALRVVRLGLEAVAVEDLHVTAMPARANRLGAVTVPHLDVRHVVLLFLHCNNEQHTAAAIDARYEQRACVLRYSKLHVHI